MSDFHSSPITILHGSQDDDSGFAPPIAPVDGPRRTGLQDLLALGISRRENPSPLLQSPSSSFEEDLEYDSIYEDPPNLGSLRLPPPDLSRRAAHLPHAATYLPSALPPLRELFGPGILPRQSAVTGSALGNYETFRHNAHHDPPLPATPFGDPFTDDDVPTFYLPSPLVGPFASGPVPDFNPLAPILAVPPPIPVAGLTPYRDLIALGLLPARTQERGRGLDRRSRLARSARFEPYSNRHVNSNLPDVRTMLADLDRVCSGHSDPRMSHRPLSMTFRRARHNPYPSPDPVSPRPVAPELVQSSSYPYSTHISPDMRAFSLPVPRMAVTSLVGTGIKLREPRPKARWSAPPWMRSPHHARRSV